MATVNLSPIGNGTTFFTATGSVNANGFLSTYQAGTSTAVATYNSSAGTVQNGTSIQLGSDGRPASEIWIVAGTAVKFVLEDSAGNPISNCTWDNIRGINDNTGLGVFWCGTATGTANALVLTPATPSTAYTAGVVYYFKSGASANSGAATGNISGLGAIAIQLNGAALTGGEIQANTWYQLLVDATTTALQLSNIGIPTTVNLNETFSGNVSVGGTLGVTGATTLAALSATTGAFSSTVSSTKTAPTGYTRRDINYCTVNNISIAALTIGSVNTLPAPTGAIYVDVRIFTNIYSDNSQALRGATIKAVDSGDTVVYDQCVHGLYELTAITASTYIAGLDGKLRCIVSGGNFYIKPTRLGADVGSIVQFAITGFGD